MTQLQSVALAHMSDACVIALAGEVDVYTAPQVRTAALDSIRSCPDQSPQIIIDLSAVTFIDSCGLGTLVEIRNLGNERNAHTSLRGVSPRTAKLLRIVGLDTVFKPSP